MQTNVDHPVAMTRKTGEGGEDEAHCIHTHWLDAKTLDLLVCPGSKLGPERGSTSFLYYDFIEWDRAGIFKSFIIYNATSCHSYESNFHERKKVRRR